MQRSLPTVSVVVPARNVVKTLAYQLKALVSQSYEGQFEVIVVNNGSTDATVDIARSFSRETTAVRIVEEPVAGLNRARNTGVKASSGELILLCDGDDIAMPDWIAMMAEASQSAELLGGAMDYVKLNDKQTRQRWGLEGIHLPSELAYDFLPAPYGANCGFMKRVWAAIGGFNEKFGSGGDDFEFFWRAQLAGYGFAWVPDAVVHYRLRDRWSDIWRRQYRFGIANVQVFREFREKGIPRSSFIIAIKSWIRLLLEAPLAMAMPSRLGWWLRAAAKRIGRIRGTILYRTIYL